MKRVISSVLVYGLLFSAASFAEVNNNAYKIDINHADIVHLQNLKGVGKRKAQAIIDYRKAHGDFKDYLDLKKVEGITAKIIADNKLLVSLSSQSITNH